MLRMAAARRLLSFLSGASCGLGMNTGRDARWRERKSQQQNGSISANMAGCQPRGCHATDTASMPEQTERYLIAIRRWRRSCSSSAPVTSERTHSAIAVAKQSQRVENVGHRGVATVEHNVRVADGCKITCAVDQQQRNRGSAFEDAVDQTSGQVALPGMDEDGSAEGCATVMGEQGCLDAVVYRRDAVGT